MTKQGAPARVRNLVVAVSAALMLAACGGEAVKEAASQDSVAPPPAGAATSTAPGNSAPQISGEPAVQTAVSALYVFQPTAYDADGDTLTFSARGLPTWATLDAGTGRISGTPEAADAGETADIELSVNDGREISTLPPFKIQIAAAPSAGESVPGTTAPSISGTPTLTVAAGTEWSFTPAASDPDTLTLTYSIANKPAWASFSSTTGKLSGTPAANHVGTYPGIVIAVSDGSAQASLPAFTITVKAAPNNAPTISGTPSGTATVGAVYRFAPSAADPDKQTLGFSIKNKPSWASFSTTTGTLTGTPGAGNVGTFANIVIGVSDGTSQVSLPAFSITVSAAPNGAPTIGGTPSTSGRVGTPYTFQPTASDPNGDTLTYSISGKPAWASFSTTTGALTGTPGAQGTYSNIVIAVSDGKSTTQLTPFSILVTQPTMGSATLSWTPPTQNTDGSSLTNLGGYRIYYGTSPSALTQTLQVTNPGLTSYTVGNLSPGTYYFALAAYTTDGVEGDASAVGSKTIL